MLYFIPSEAKQALVTIASDPCCSIIFETSASTVVNELFYLNEHINVCI